MSQWGLAACVTTAFMTILSCNIDLQSAADMALQSGMAKKPEQ